MNTRLTIAVALTAFLAASVTVAFGGADGPKVVFRLDAADGKPPSREDVKRAIEVMEGRLDRAGIDECTVTPDGALITVTLASAAAPNLESISKLLERPGTLELRIWADAATERKFAASREAAGGSTDLPLDYRWVPRSDGSPSMLVLTPEMPLLAELRKLEKAGVATDAAEYLAAKKRYEDLVRDEVFTGDQIARAEVQAQSAKNVVFFSFKDDRKSCFAKFTEKHVHECVAIILDGKVHSAPVVNSKLPGEGIIEGGGATGFTKREATDLANVLAVGPFSGRLVRVPPPEKK